MVFKNGYSDEENEGATQKRPRRKISQKRAQKYVEYKDDSEEEKGLSKLMKSRQKQKAKQK